MPTPTQTANALAQLQMTAGHRKFTGLFFTPLDTELSYSIQAVQSAIPVLAFDGLDCAVIGQPTPRDGRRPIPTVVVELTYPADMDDDDVRAHFDVLMTDCGAMLTTCGHLPLFAEIHPEECHHPVTDEIAAPP